ncbi:glycoside hydrolase family 13 protein, partial [Nonomuraea sp. NPDC004297]
GLRWLHADADCLVFARETEEETILVAARRAPGRPLAIGTPATGLYNAQDGDVVPGDGPSLRMWRLTH